MDTTSPKISIKDIFCDYTSISGVRFLHSRHPLWFRYLSACVLILAVCLFFFHVSKFFKILMNSRSAITFVSTEGDNVIYPSIMLCPGSPVISCQWVDGSDCLTYINITTEFEKDCVEIVTQSSYTFNSLFEVIQPIKISFDYSSMGDNVTTVYLKIGSLNDYDYISTVSRGESLNAVIDYITENLEAPDRLDLDGKEYLSAFFAGDATRFNLDNQETSSIAEVTVQYREGTFHQTDNSDGYTLLNLTIDLGSSLSLYFGFTVLTLFEVIIFFFYGRSDDIVNLYPPPSKAIIYDLPNKKVLENRSKTDIRRKLAAEKRRQQTFASMIPPIY